MATKWFRRVNGEEVGPHSADELKALAQSGELLPDDLIWKEGLAEWVPARKVTGLFDGVKSANPPQAPKPEIIVQAPRKQHVWTTAASKYASGCLGTFGVLSAMGIVSILTVVLVCGGGIVVLMNAFDKGEQDGNPVQRGAGNPIAADDEDKPFGINEVAAVESVGIAVTKAEVGIVPLIDFLGDDTSSEDPALTITLRVENTDERKIVRRVDNAFLATDPRLEDDAGNMIRGVRYGAAKPKGEMNEDLNPGDTMTHVEVFTVPPPATKFLVLTIDFEIFGSEGEATFQISVDDIEGWPVE